MITRDSTFNDVFGDYMEAYTEDQRKERWKEYRNACSKNIVKFWTETTECEGCKHLNKAESWCKDTGLPCTVNPVFGFTMIGMACRGLGFEALEPELQLFSEK